MSCIFCDSLFHLSQYCDIFISNDERQKIAMQKRRCFLCLNNLGDKLKCENGTCNPKCYICFSQNHHTVYCPYRFKASKFFLPSIDKNLLSRFMQILDIEEQYFLAFSYPAAYNTIKLKPLLIQEKQKIDVTNIEQIPEFNTVVTKNIKFDFLLCRKMAGSDGFKSYILETMIFKLENVLLTFFPFSGRELLRLLSVKTKTFYCKSVNISSPVKLTEILQNAPNIENLDFENTNIKLSYSWPEELMEWSCENLKLIIFELEAFNCNVQSLADLIKVRKEIKIFLYLKIHNGVPFNKKDVLQNISYKLSIFFLPVNYCDRNESFLCISFVNKDRGTCNYEYQYYRLRY